MMRGALCSLPILFTAALFAGCSEETPADAGRPDATVFPDAAPPEDAGEAPDAGTVPDSGVITDAQPTDAAGGQDSGLPPLECSGSTLRAISTDTSTVGPWPVGARTATIAGLTAEVWYPAVPGSEANSERVRYDIRMHLPASERQKIPDNLNPWQDCNCYRDLALDEDYGPYPVIVFVHGTAGFRHQSLAQVTHWASRGFVVVAVDHPGLVLAHVLGVACGGTLVPQHLADDLNAVLAALDAPAGGLEFLAGHIDPARLGMSGHSAGGNAIRGAGARASVLIPLAAGGTQAGASLRSSLVMAANQDSVVRYPNTINGYESSPSPKRFVGIANTGHLAFSSLCSLTNAQGQNLIQVSLAQGVCGVGLAGMLFDCDETYLSDPEGWRIINDATSAAFEETLQCRAKAGARFDMLEAIYGDDIAEVRQSR